MWFRPEGSQNTLSYEVVNGTVKKLFHRYDGVEEINTVAVYLSFLRRSLTKHKASNNKKRVVADDPLVYSK